MAEMTEVRAPWLAGGVALVCDKCVNVRFAEDFPEHAGDPRLDVRSYLKERLKREGHWGPIRVVGTSCLDVCGKGTVTVLFDPIGSGAQERAYVVDPLAGREELYDRIVAELSP
jgi:hypothetical protein